MRFDDEEDCWREEGAGRTDCRKSCVYVCVGEREGAHKQKLVETGREGKMTGQETGQIYRVPFQFLKAYPHYITSSDYRGSGEALW